MAIKIPQNVQKALNATGKGLISEFAPGVAAGVLGEWMRGISVKGAASWVEQDVNLLEKITPNHRHHLGRLKNFCHDYKWMTLEWGIKAIRETNPALASLFLGWDEGREWLIKQLALIKQELQGGS